MSELQTGLLVISAVIVIAVLVYNKIEQLRLRRTTQAAFGSSHEDVLLKPMQTEAPEPSTAYSADLPSYERIEHTLGHFGADQNTEPKPEPEMAALKVHAPAFQSAALDPDIDYIVDLELPRDYSGAEVMQHAGNFAVAALRKPVHWEGLDNGLKSWQPVHSAHMYRQLRVGIQLVNRAGPTDEDELTVFLVSVRDIAESLGARMESDEPQQAKQRALALDAFCADHDIQIGLSVLGREGETLQGTKIRALAEANGCVLARDGRFHKFNEQGALLYALSNTEPMPFHPETLKTLNTRGVGLTLDVPRAPGTPATFRAYIEFARQLAQALGGVLVDDERKAISDAAVEQIAAQLNTLYQAMAVRGIPAGGAIALRLFA